MWVHWCISTSYSLSHCLNLPLFTFISHFSVVHFLPAFPISSFPSYIVLPPFLPPRLVRPFYPCILLSFLSCVPFSLVPIVLPSYCPNFLRQAILSFLSCSFHFFLVSFLPFPIVSLLFMAIVSGFCSFYI